MHRKSTLEKTTTMSPSVLSSSAMHYPFRSSSLLLGLIATLSGCSGNEPSNGQTPTQPAPTEIKTAQGTVVGSVSDSTRLFLGIPYAAPPTGDNRFRPPQPAPAFATPFQANTFSPKCPQLATSLGGGDPKYDATTNEDCLTLNIWAPATITTARPVMVWIHGGGSTSGSGSEVQYNGQNLSAAENTIIVTLNYRLGPLGYAAHPAFASEDAAFASSGNYGLLDMQAALKWVKDNIAAFGGDPNKVTVFGESAGAISICELMVSPASTGLFQGAISESGYCTLLPLPDRASFEAQGKTLADTLGCTGDDAAIRTCMRGKKPEEVLLALPLQKEVIFGDGVSWGPHVDGVVVPDQPKALITAQKEAPVPWILGTNADEGTIFFKFLGAHFADVTAAKAALAEIFGNTDTPDLIAAHYQLDKATDLDAAAIEVVDDLLACDALRTAKLHTASKHPAFTYYFTRAYPAAFPGLGAFHSAEIPYIFANPFLGGQLGDDDLPLSTAMQGYWTRFAAAADPSAGAPAETVAWPNYGAASGKHLKLDLQIALEAHPRQASCDWIESALP